MLASMPRPGTTWVRTIALAAALFVALAMAGAIFGGCAYSDPIRRLAAHMYRDAGAVAAAHADDPAATRLVTATEAFAERAGQPNEPVAIEAFDADIAAVGTESTTRGRILATIQSTGVTLWMILAGIAGTVLTAMIGPPVVRRIGNGVAAGIQWLRVSARRMGVPDEVVQRIADEAAKRLTDGRGQDSSAAKG
jgi:hypothetical protein